jgi:hypothetical protein
VGACCCLQCQKRTGSVFGVVAYFPKDKVQVLSGPSKVFTRTGESGGSVDIYFCPSCGSSVFSEASVYPDIRGVTVGCFADPSFAAPQVVAWDLRRHAWVNFPANINLVKTQMTQSELDTVFANR